jgi:hypothetical protein
MALLLSLAFSLVAAVLSIVFALDSSAVPVDFEGEPLGQFAGVSREAHALITGEPPVTETTSYFDAMGPVVVVFIVLPVLVAAGAFISHRRRVQSRPLTIGLIGMALVTVVNPFSVYFLPSLIALAVAGFQVRKAEVPARMAPRRGGATRDEDEDEDDEVIDVEEVEDVEDVDEPAEDEADRGKDKHNGDAHDDAEQDDILAELDAEIENESTDEPKSGRSDGGPNSGGRSSSR